MPNLSNTYLYGIVDFGYVQQADMKRVAGELLAGGADILQLRAKGIPLDKVADAARKIIPLCKAAGVPFILNDHPDLAAELGADGVHIGQDDGSIYDVRSRIPDGMIIGRSTHRLAQILVHATYFPPNTPLLALAAVVRGCPTGRDVAVVVDELRLARE